MGEGMRRGCCGVGGVLGLLGGQRHVQLSRASHLRAQQVQAVSHPAQCPLDQRQPSHILTPPPRATTPLKLSSAPLASLSSAC